MIDFLKALINFILSHMLIALLPLALAQEEYTVVIIISVVSSLNLIIGIQTLRGRLT